jgi:UDP-N-acetylglucosamine 4,6-dehydratase
MRSVLVTGATGAFGTAFTERLLKDGLASRICVFSRGEYRQFLMRKQFKDDPRLRFFIGDVRDRWRLTRAMEGCDVVVHAAALKRIEVGRYDPEEMIKTNVDGAINVVEAARAGGVKKVVALSSDKAFQPISPYGQSKALAEALFLAANENSGRSGPRFAVCRYGNVWKSTGSVAPVWSAILEDGDTHVPITDPECTRFFMRMDDAVQLVLNTAQTMPDEIAIPTLPAYRLGDLAEAMGAKTITIGLPKWEKLHESMDENNCSKDARRMSIEELKAEL